MPEPFTFLFVVALELVFGEHVIRDDVISLPELVPLGREQEEDEENENGHAKYDVKYPVTTDLQTKDGV